LAAVLLAGALLLVVLLAFESSRAMLASARFSCFFLAASQEMGWEQRLQYDLFCVEWNKKTSTQSISGTFVHV